MGIANLVDQIIAQRQAKLPAIAQKQDELKKIVAVLDEFDDLKGCIVDRDGEVLEGKYKQLAKRNPEMPIRLHAMTTEACRKKLEAAIAESGKVYARFSRESINLAVVGPARIGKSKLLQAISTLPNEVIPAYADTDCTGAVSIIENDPSKVLEAELTFRTEEQMVEIVQSYLDKLLPDEESRMVVRTMYQIRDLDLDEVKRRLIPGRAENNLLHYLRAYVEHYEEWAALVKERTKTLYKKEEIQTYVAQNNGKTEDDPARESYYKYLAVDECHIRCPFDYAEAGKINLVDTIGFEDNAIGIEDALLKVVHEKSDAVIFMLFPLSGAGGGVPNKITDIYKKIQESCADKNLNKWLAWLINHAPNHPKTANPIEYCNTALKTLGDNGWDGDLRKIVDVSDVDQVREEFLIPLLQNLTESLDEIDKLYLKDLEKVLDAVRKEFAAFCAAARKVMESQVGSTAAMGTDLFNKYNQMNKILIGGLNAMTREEKEKRDVPCRILEQTVDSILEDMVSGALVPDADSLLQEVRQATEASTVYTRHCNRLRSAVVQKFAGVDVPMEALVAEAKDKVARLLISDDGCKLGALYPPEEERVLYPWMLDFSEQILSENKYPILAGAFRAVHDFSFSVNGFLTYEVRACLDGLDPQLTETNVLANDGVERDRRTAVNINFWLTKRLLDAVDLLRSRLNELFCKPHRAFFAMMKEFSDSVLHTEGAEQEWYSLYASNYTTIWAEEAKNQVLEEVAFGAWNDLLKKIIELNSKLGKLHQF